MIIAGLDVVRTDQALVFYQNESNQAKLWNVLSVYAWVDSDISYVQGMNIWQSLLSWLSFPLFNICPDLLL